MKKIILSTIIAVSTGFSMPAFADDSSQGQNYTSQKKSSGQQNQNKAVNKVKYGKSEHGDYVDYKRDNKKSSRSYVKDINPAIK